MVIVEEELLEVTNTDLSVVQNEMMLDEVLVIGSNVDMLVLLVSFCLGVLIMIFCALVVHLFFLAKGDR